MNETNGKLFSVGKILAGLIFCSVVTLFICAVSILYLFGIENCPPGGCQASASANFLAYLSLSSPFLVFAFGAYLLRNDIYALTEKRFLRAILLLSFAFFPILLIAGLFVLAVNS